MQNETMEISLRNATPEDDAFLFEVYASTRLDDLAATGWDDNQKRAFLRMQFLIRQKSYPQADDNIILLNGRPVGRMLVDRRGAEIALTDIALLPEYRRTGIGSRLIQDLMKEATSARKPIQLQVLASSPAARLYERLGFSRSATEASDAVYLEMKWVPATS